MSTKAKEVKTQKRNGSVSVALKSIRKHVTTLHDAKKFTADQYLDINRILEDVLYKHIKEEYGIEE